MCFPCQALTLSPELQFSMNLIVDIGNSSVKAALFNGQQLVQRKRLSTSSLMDDLVKFVANVQIDACAYSRVGSAQSGMDEFLRSLTPHVYCITGQTPIPLVNDYETPQTLGADRLAAAVGAATLCPASDLLIVDAGTCITYDYVSAEGHYLGGNISPGIGIRLRALHDQTLLLPLVTAEGSTQFPGRNTATAIRSGVISGLEFEIAGYVKHFVASHPSGKVFLTGGNARRFAQIQPVERNETLVETGLNAILLQLLRNDIV